MTNWPGPYIVTETVLIKPGPSFSEKKKKQDLVITVFQKRRKTFKNHNYMSKKIPILSQVVNL